MPPALSGSGHAGSDRELAALRAENARLRQLNDEAFAYVRAKVDDLLGTLGTRHLRPEELDDRSLLAFDPIGIVTDSFGYVLDHLRQTNRRLQEAHAEIQAIFDTVGAALLVLDPQRRIEAFNQKAAHLLVEHPGNLLGSDCRAAVCGGVASEAQCVFSRVLATAREAAMPGWRLGGRTFDVIARPLLDEQGRVSRVVIAYHDVSAHRGTEAALRRSLADVRETQSKIRGILRAAADGLLLTDGRGRVVLINHRAEQLFGLAQAPAEELPSYRVIGHPGLIDLLAGARHHRGELLVADLHMPGAEGHVVEARVTIIRGRRGAFRGCITSLHDVSAQRQVERMKSDFVATAAHELRTPLATIVGYADLLINSPEQTRARLGEFLGIIQDRAEHLAHIVSDLLDISRIEAGEGVKLIFQPCRLDALCAEVAAALAADSGRPPILLDFPDGGMTVSGDRHALIQVIENLLGNAVKYSLPGGSIRLSGRVAEPVCELAVADCGIGMTPEQVARIFEKFYRANTASPSVPGTGLGMTIVKYLVEAHHGEVTVESEPGAGTTVRVRLPLRQALAE